jgi:hypothetical protein
MIRRMTFPLAALAASVALSLACSDSEAPAEDHTPVAFLVLVNNVEVVGDTVPLTANGTDSIRIKFVNAEDDTLDDVEAEHYSLLTFNPSAGIAATVDPNHHFRHEVVTTAAAGTAGDLTIGYGHDALADENQFPVAFKVQ